MKKLSVSLKESRFVDLINKKFTGETRKEDTIVNLKELKPVDIGTSVLWADNDLCVDDKYLLTFDDVTDILKMNGSKWRLPTVSEVRELKRCKQDLSDGEHIFTNNGKSLTFYEHGYIHVTEDDPIEGSDIVMGWTSDSSADNNHINIYLMDDSSFVVDEKYYFENKNSLLSARLVKDK